MAVIKINPSAFNMGGPLEHVPVADRNKFTYIIKGNGSGNVPLGTISKDDYANPRGSYARGLSSSSLWADVNGQTIHDEDLATLAASYENNPSNYIAPLISAMQRGIVQVLDRNNNPLTPSAVRAFVA